MKQRSNYEIDVLCTFVKRISKRIGIVCVFEREVKKM